MSDLHSPWPQTISERGRGVPPNRAGGRTDRHRHSELAAQRRACYAHLILPASPTRQAQCTRVLGWEAGEYQPSQGEGCEMNRKAQCHRLFGGLYLVAFVTVSVVWIGHAQQRQTPASQENPFTGTSFRIDSEGINLSSRGFEPGARTHWHTHSAQLLFVKEGRLRYQVDGQPVGEVRSARDRVSTPRRAALAWRGTRRGTDTRLGDLSERRGRTPGHPMDGAGHRRPIRWRNRALMNAGPDPD